tara:strand:+ start:3823 stop:4020 length:198 start_codon:yes stop_codon:yes gene_type:complete
MERLLAKINKKIEQIEKLHDKASLLCEEVKDITAEIEEDHVEEKPLSELEDDIDDLDEEDIDEEQ